MPGPLTAQAVNIGDAQVARTAPMGVVYTTRQMRTADGRHVVTVCVANIGVTNVPEVNVTFALSQPDAAIVSLRAPSAPSEVSSNQARAIIRDVPPGQQVQVDIVINSKDPLRDGQPEIAVPEAYRLTSDDPVLICSPRDAALDPAEAVEAQFIIAGETVETDQAAAALINRLGAFSAVPVDQKFQARPAEAVLSTTVLRALLIASGVLALVLVVLFFVRMRQRRMSG
ncbi:MAG: hypothetical protein KatS3mg053_3227 [Candidatus Roseilinea sp.]|nr:MAG: hypothetical protein KatS3mg053_3227 [Candidatus Roseilinea sp.]